ncbi:MAG TPA: AsmA-like C-terminal region-containing protein [Anaeromyxobacteraceae bacterium]|nr:AsmA-like C-terminal region-containing protein [Anaeromyxobacteraceae bacterium]
MTQAHPRRRRWPLVVGGVVLVLVVAVVVAVLALDSILLSQVRKQTDLLSRDLGRPVTVDGIRTKFLGGLGVRVTGVQVGAGPGENLPLATLQRAEVEVDLLRAALSRGKDVNVREAVLDGLRVNVVRLPDGTTNAQRVSDALAKRAGAEKKPEQPAKESDLSFVHVDRAAVQDARIAFVDRSVANAPEVAVNDLDVEVRDLAAGRPLEVVLNAAVLAQKQNLEVRVKAAPLPPSLTPTPTAVVVRAQPIDLAPLAPFLPPTTGFRGGHFQADLDAVLGALVPGGSGPAHVKGGFKATALRFEAQEGGKPLDVVFQSDLDADLDKGTVRIASLRLDAGPASLTGKGNVSDFLGATPRVQGLEIVGSGLDPALLAAYYPPLKKQLAGQIAGPIGLQIRGGGTQASQQIELRLDFASVRLDVPRTLSKGAGAPLLVTANVRALGGGGQVAFDVAADAAGVDLRPGGSIAKKPGDPLAVTAAGTWSRAGNDQKLDLSRLDLVLLADRLSGKAKATLGGTKAQPTTTFDAELQGARLDLDRLLIPTPPDKPESKPLEKKTFAGLSGEARVKLDLLRVKKVDARNVVARVRVREDEITMEEARLEVLGGTVSAAGTQVRLATPDAPFHVVTELKGIGAEAGTAMLWDRKVVTGKLDGKLDLAGKGFEMGQIAKAATGALAGALHDGAFLGKDLLASITGPIATKLPFGAKALSEGGVTSLGKDLGFEFKIDRGTATLAKPLQIQRGDTALALQGGVRLDGTLDMPGTISLTPELVSRLTGGRAKPANAIPVPFRLSGPVWSPTVGDLGIEAVVQAILKEAGSAAAARALGVKDGDVGAAAEQKKAELKARADAERQAAEQRARDEAEKRKQQVEEEAKKKLRGLFGR